ncbi:non-canonical purine NTP pyrophosphatase, RdgB/HAM1 family [Hydrococcus rivularis NIES-593]|uniref:dITP/XTP pyrophosphatase n=1 Tax=Hydrococcus rivularis NIES-593 TaxID=1921803 RepID=A0A1U7HAA7_9CYAN|nr:RdgB/HAM1 family non-canonical purine NTP pyrophosphatase [Hydrococcus rivularis]OKH20516.1 non-canonical purine NTP pyrophosphatase, RdgB/HAM1 family [Hydrococcus rivularis NIES-593]
MRKLIVATGNPGKLREIQEYLTGFAWELQLKPDDLDIEETGDTFIANACFKASQVARALGEWAIADDSGLEVEALGGAPGIYSARYGKTDQERIERLLKELGDSENRRAQFVCAVAIARRDGSIAAFVEGTCPGEILREPCGTGGFGYDPIFYVPQQQQTFAQMQPEVKRKLSHRGRAFEKLLPKLREIESEV